MRKNTSVGMGEMVISSDQDSDLLCLGLGSCIAVCAYHPRRRIGAMIHIVLPTAKGRTAEPAAKYADTAIPLLANELRKLGVRLTEMRIVLCGGASIFPMNGSMNIGERNLHAVRHELHKAGFLVRKEAVGGKESRTVIMNMETGAVNVRTVREGESLLASLGE